MVIGLITFLVINLNNNHGYSIFRSKKISDNLLIDKVYTGSFDLVDIDSNAADIYIKENKSENVHIIIYGKDNTASVKQENSSIKIDVKTKTCKFLCINTTISKVEVYLPKAYEKKINIKNNFGDISVERFEKANIKIEEDAGDIDVTSADIINIINHYGNIKVGAVNEITANEDLGDIRINTVNGYLDLENNCGDIKIENAFINKSSYIKNDLGDIKIGKTTNININAKTSLGDVKVNKTDKEANISLVITNNLGDIVVNN